MKQHIPFPSIGQFRNVVTDINRRITYVGKDEAGEAIYNASIKKPIIHFSGTVKLHGTNAGICYNTTDGLWSQSRTQIITPDSDNQGFAAFVEERKNELSYLLIGIALESGLNLDVFTLALFGEWAGKGIQSGVGISLAEKAFYIFGLKVSNPSNPEFVPYWLNCENISLHEINIRNIHEFETYQMDVDFNMPQLSQNNLAYITEKVEGECPVAKALGFPGELGEGVVWTATYNGETYRFKVKGEKHSSTKVKTLANVDVEKLGSIQQFVDYAVTKNRIQQALTEVFGTDPPSMNKMGDVLRWVINDIKKEESDSMEANGLVAKDVNRYLANKSRELFIETLNYNALSQ